MNPSPTWDRVQAAFHEVLELDPPAREAFLSKIAAADPDLAREVGSLLTAHHEAGGFLSDPAAPVFVLSAAPGDRIGPYRILEETGRGGMGIVYRATRDDENFQKEVAIKLIYPGMRTDEILKRFRVERQILARLDHPNIARLIDGGTAPDGSPFLVMEYVDGKPLLAYCDANHIDVHGRLAIFLQVCEAVQFAHQRLVIHRDLKPDNIVVTEDGSPKLLDFGIAKLLSPDTDGTPATLTAPMQRLMTLDYASPEQVRGEPVTVASDVYSLGVILYELLSGRRPFQFSTRSPEEILRVIAEQDPVPPSAAVTGSATEDAAARRGDTVQRLHRRLTGDLDCVVLKALEKEPGRRYGSADHLAEDIRRHLEGLPVLARGRSRTYLLSRFVRRHRAGVVAGSLVALSLIAGLAGTSWQANLARHERDRANRRFNDVRSLAHAVIFDIHNAIENLPGSTKARETLVKHALVYLNRLSGETRGDHALEHELGVAYAKIGDVQGRPMYPNLGQTTEALESYTKALALLEPASAARPDSIGFARDVIVTTQRLADLLQKMGRRDEALAQSIRARDRILSELAKHPDEEFLPGDLLLAYDRMSDMKLAAADTLGAIEEREHAMNLAEQIFQKDPRDPQTRRGVLVAVAKSAVLLAARGKREEALASYRRAEKIAVEAAAALDNNNEARRDLSVVYGMIGLFLAEGGEVDSALAVYGRSMRISEEMAAADPDDVLQQSDVASGHFETGTILMGGRRYEAAFERFREAFDRFSRLAATDTANVECRSYAARSARLAGEASAALAKGADSAAGRSRWRARALDWLGRSRNLYAALERGGALNGEETTAPAAVAREIADLQAP